jgi:hypothetical protein
MADALEFCFECLWLFVHPCPVPAKSMFLCFTAKSCSASLSADWARHSISREQEKWRAFWSHWLTDSDWSGTKFAFLFAAAAALPPLIRTDVLWSWDDGRWLCRAPVG